MNNETFVINIGRQLGSGGRAIGHLLANHFGIAYYDKEILALAAKESGLCTEIFEKSDEHKGFFRSVFGSLFPFLGDGDFYSNQISDESLFRIQSEAIRKAAAAHSSIFIGRCADYILRDHKRCINVFIAADMEDRIRRVSEFDGISPEEAEKKITAGDKNRADYYNFYSSGTWGAAATYHLCINSSRLGIDETARYIIDFIEKSLGLPSKSAPAR